MWEAAPTFCVHEDGPLLTCASMTTRVKAVVPCQLAGSRGFIHILAPPWSIHSLVGNIWALGRVCTSCCGRGVALEASAHSSLRLCPPLHTPRPGPSRPPWSRLRGPHSLLSTWPGGPWHQPAAPVAPGPPPSRWDLMLRGSDTGPGETPGERVGSEVGGDQLPQPPRFCPWEHTSRCLQPDDGWLRSIN